MLIHRISLRGHRPLEKHRTLLLVGALVVLISAAATGIPSTLIDERDGWMQIQVGVSITTPGLRPSADIVFDLGGMAGLGVGGVIRIGPEMGIFPELLYLWSPAGYENLSVPLKIGLEGIMPLSVSIVTGAKGFFTEIDGPLEEKTYLTADVLAGIIWSSGGGLRFRAMALGGTISGLSAEKGWVTY